LLNGSPSLALERIVELICADQIGRWRDGQRVPAEAYLALHPALEPGSDAALEVVFGEFALRGQAGESPTVQGDQRGFPQLGDRLRQMVEIHRLTESAFGLSRGYERPKGPMHGEANGGQQPQPDSLAQQTEAPSVGAQTQPGSTASEDRLAPRDARWDRLD